MGARNREGIGLSHRPARLHRLANSFLGINSGAPYTLKNTYSDILFTHLAMFLAATQSLSRDKKVTASRDLTRSDCVTDSVKGCNHTLLSPSLCDSERSGIMRELASCDSVTSACQRNTVT